MDEVNSVGHRVMLVNLLTMEKVVHEQLLHHLKSVITEVTTFKKVQLVSQIAKLIEAKLLFQVGRKLHEDKISLSLE